MATSSFMAVQLATCGNTDRGKFLFLICQSSNRGQKQATSNDNLAMFMIA